MIQILADNVLAYDSRLEDYDLQALMVTRGLNKGGTASITMPPNHPAYNMFTSYKTIVEIYRDGLLRFRGRALYPTDDRYNCRTITCEGELCFFQDAVSRPYLYRGTPAEVFEAVVGVYNEQVEEPKRFRVGTITVVDANDYIRLEHESAEPVADTIKKLLDRCGGYIVFTTDPEDGARVINWYATMQYRSNQVIEFGENLLDFARQGVNVELATAVLPYGAKDETTGQRITIESVNNGLDYIEDAEAVALRGRIIKAVTWDDVTTPANLLRKAQQWLNDNRYIVTSLVLTALDLSVKEGAPPKILVESDVVILPEQTLQISSYSSVSGFQQKIEVGLDYEVTWNGEKYICTAFNYDGGAHLGNPALLSYCPLPATDDPFIITSYGGKGGFVGQGSGNVQTVTLKITGAPYYVTEVGIDSFQEGDNIRVLSKPHGVDDYFLLTEQTEDMLNPDGGQITMGKDLRTLTDADVAGDEATRGEIHKTKHEIKADYQLNIAQAVQATEQVLSSMISQTSDAIRTEVSQTYATNEQLLEAVSTTMTQLSDQFLFEFSTLKALVDENDAEAREQLTEIYKYISFKDGNIQLGASDSAITLTIENDMIVFKKNGVQFGWWDGVDFHTGNIVVEVNERAQFGNFAFIPRSNGSLSFLKVGG